MADSTGLIKVRTVLVGTTAYLQHNEQLADPDNHYARQISALTSKRSKTEDDRKEIERLEWMGGLYTHEGRIVVPKNNLRGCFRDTAKVIRQGKNISRALSAADPVELSVPLVFPDDSKTIEEVRQTGDGSKYRDKRMVKVTGRMPRVRPYFAAWSVTAEWLLLTSVVDFDVFRQIVRQAGVIEGLGDNRINGMGRFTATVTEL